MLGRQVFSDATFHTVSGVVKQPTLTKVEPTPRNNIPQFCLRKFVGKVSTVASRHCPNISKVGQSCLFSDRYFKILGTMRRRGHHTMRTPYSSPRSCSVLSMSSSACT